MIDKEGKNEDELSLASSSSSSQSEQSVKSQNQNLKRQRMEIIDNFKKEIEMGYRTKFKMKDIIRIRQMEEMVESRSMREDTLGFDKTKSLNYSIACKSIVT